MQVRITGKSKDVSVGLIFFRRLSRDFEKTTQSSIAFIQLVIFFAKKEGSLTISVNNDNDENQNTLTP